jgi:hypothetical protein
MIASMIRKPVSPTISLITLLDSRKPDIERPI